MASKSKRTGSGLTEEDIARGITLEMKLNKACPFFYRMHALFGTKSNMVPPATCELGIPAVPAVQMISKDEDDRLDRSAPDGGSDANGRSTEVPKANRRSEKRQITVDNLSEASLRSVKQKSQPKLKGNLQSILAEELRKKEEFWKSLLEAKVALLQEQRIVAEQERMERKKAFELEQEERRVQRKMEADIALATKLFTELAKSDRPPEEVKNLVDFFFKDRHCILIRAEIDKAHGSLNRGTLR
ncbi:hypothetical protein R1sor_007365 [Riccia sorocarpa]|uniref:Uncharacterized protein n=1 Tax=Riccia sorocarpa TaxID=122646 RepID=A0ABD3HSW7_9MARC